MHTLDDFLPEPRLCEIDAVHVDVPPARAFELVRELDLTDSPLVSALFWLRRLPERLAGKEARTPRLRLRDIGRGGDSFQVLAEDNHRLCVGAIGRFWEPDITWAQVTPAEFAGWSEPGFGKLAWELRCEEDGPGTRVVFELRVSATDDAAWHKQQRYFRLIGPFSHFIRRHTLARFARELGAQDAADETRALPGDTLIAAKAQMTHAITIEAPASKVWPWLVQMGCGRGGFYSYDDLDNAGVLSATEIIPEYQKLAVGDRLAATPEGDAHFTVLVLEPERALVLGGLYDTENGVELPMDAPRPPRFWQVTWAFVLEPTPQGATRLLARGRADYAPDALSVVLAARTRGVVHHFMQRRQLANIKRRAEGTFPRVHDTWHDVAQGLAGATGIVADLVTPFLRGARSHWGLSDADANRDYPGDELLPDPRWQWTHAIEIGAEPSRVWPWLAQLGQDRAGFYSHQFLENLAGSEIQNAWRVHPEWQDPRPGDPFRLHPKMPPLEVVKVEPGRCLVVHAGPREKGPANGDRYVAVSWLFMVEPRPDGRTRAISRFRCDCSTDLVTRIAYGPYLTESVGFVMDRRMLRGLRERVEASAVERPAT